MIVRLYGVMIQKYRQYYLKDSIQKGTLSLQKLLKKLKSQGGEHILFLGATIMSAGIHFIYSIYVKAYIAPLEYGIYSTCLLLQTYMAYLQLGSLNAFNRDYPQLTGAGKLEEAKKYRNVVFSFLLSVYLISLILIIFGIIIVGNAKPLDTRFTYGFILSAIITVVTIIENYGNYRCRIDKGFRYPSMVTILELLSIPLGLFLIPKFGYYAVYITNITAMFIGIVFYFKPSFNDFKPNFDFRLLKTVLISGIPLLVNGLVWTVVNSIDKFVILGFIDAEALGIYGIAQNAFSYMVLVPSAMSQLFYVKMGKKYGASGKVETLTNVSMKFSSILAMVTSLVSLIAYFFLPVLVNKFMPRYSNGVSASQILILGLSIYAVTLINGNILTILKKNKALLISSVCMCIFNIVCSITYAIFIGAKIESVALGTATSYIFYSFIIIYQVKKYAGCKIKQLINASVIPVCISLIPGVMLYNLAGNLVAGFSFALVLVVIFYSFFYRKQIFLIIKEQL